LKIAEKGHRLPLFEQNIRRGNSLIDDESIAGEQAFKWEEQFDEIMKEGGFDIVIGNPPYVRIQTLDKTQVNFFNTHYKAASKNYDIYARIFQIWNSSNYYIVNNISNSNSISNSIDNSNLVSNTNSNNSNSNSVINSNNNNNNNSIANSILSSITFSSIISVISSNFIFSSSNNQNNIAINIATIEYNHEYNFDYGTFSITGKNGLFYPTEGGLLVLNFYSNANVPEQLLLFVYSGQVGSFGNLLIVPTSSCQEINGKYYHIDSSTSSNQNGDTNYNLVLSETNTCTYSTNNNMKFNVF
jgi:hypothetical protein